MAEAAGEGEERLSPFPPLLISPGHVPEPRIPNPAPDSDGPSQRVFNGRTSSVHHGIGITGGNLIAIGDSLLPQAGRGPRGWLHGRF